jgi:predicted aldo/keto reductase-like oxidoreductase
LEVAVIEYFNLGQTGLQVSALCFGILPMGPLQADLSVEAGGALILEGLNRGINFIDTAELYQTYPHIKWALERFSGKAVLASKSSAATYREMHESVAKCLNALGRDHLEIFHLPAPRDSNPLVNRAGALEALLELKSGGVIQAVGLASHSMKGILQGAEDSRIDVIFPLINRTGLGILDGGVAEMTRAISIARSQNKGIYAMKALGGGNLLEDVVQNINFVRFEVGVPVVAIGMLRPVELEMNLDIFEGRPVPDRLIDQAKQYRKKAKVIFLCKGCGHCITICHNDAIQIVNGKAIIDEARCLLCGYCSRECPQFAIRVI